MTRPMTDYQTVVWDTGSDALVAPESTYARMAPIPSGWLLVCERHGAVVVRRADKALRAWTPLEVLARRDGSIYANPEILALPERRGLLLFINERPLRDGQPYRILVCRGDADGRRWTEPEVAYTGGTTGITGCWEPVGVVLPDGSIGLLFANEAPYGDGQQEITGMRSTDDGRSWGQPVRLCFRPKGRDGMPSPCVLSDGSLVTAIEDFELGRVLQPWICRLAGPGEPWSEAGVSADRRWPALRDPMPPLLYGGAPCLRRLPSGMTVLSVMLTDPGRSQPWMVVFLGDRQARGFAGRSVPYAVAPDVGAFWGSLCVLGPDRLAALSALPDGVHLITGRVTYL